LQLRISERIHLEPDFSLSAKARNDLPGIGDSPAQGLPAGTRARQILDRLLIDLSWNSSRLEGNTRPLLETERLLEEGIATEGKDARETPMILNHKRAIELMVQDGAEVGFNRYTILNLHASLAENLFANPVAAGRLRQIAVGLDGSVFHPLEGPRRIEEIFDLFLHKARKMKDPFEQSFFAMVHSKMSLRGSPVWRRTSPSSAATSARFLLWMCRNATMWMACWESMS
jgi:hypothetical protein